MVRMWWRDVMVRTRAWGRMRRLSRAGAGTRGKFSGTSGTAVPSGGRPDSVARLARLHDRLCAVLDFELVEDARDHVAHGFLAEAQMGGDLVVVEAAGQQLE